MPPNSSKESQLQHKAQKVFDHRRRLPMKAANEFTALMILSGPLRQPLYSRLTVAISTLTCNARCTISGYR
jgi:hypothetical protein